MSDKVRELVREFTIPCDVRAFFRAGGGKGSLLGRTGFRLTPGTKVLIGEPITMSYDHQNKLAFPIAYQGQEYFVLQEELQLPEFVGMANKVKARFEASFSGVGDGNRQEGAEPSRAIPIQSDLDATEAWWQLEKLGLPIKPPGTLEERMRRHLERFKERDPYAPVRVATCPVCAGDVMRLYQQADYDFWNTSIGTPITMKPYLACVGRCKILFSAVPEERPWNEKDKVMRVVLITNLPDDWKGSPEEQARLLTRDDAEKHIHCLEGTREEVCRQLDSLLAEMIAQDEQLPSEVSEVSEVSEAIK